MATQYRSQKRAIMYVGSESTYGTAETIDVTNFFGLRVSNPKIAPQGKDIGAVSLSDNFTQTPGMKSLFYAKLTFDVELTGNGDAAAPDFPTAIKKLLGAVSLLDGSWDWEDSNGANPVSCSTEYWAQLNNADDCTPFKPLRSLWLVENSAETPVNRKIVALSPVVRKGVGADASKKDRVLVALEDATGINLTKSQEFRADNANAPDTGNLATVNMVDSNAVLEKGASYRLTSDLDTIRANSVTLLIYVGGNILHAMTGCLGNMKVSIGKDKNPLLSFEFTGSFKLPVDQAALSDMTFYQHLPPRIEDLSMSFADPSGVGLTSVYKPAVTEFSLDLGNKIEPIPNVNIETSIDGMMFDREGMSAGLDPAAVNLADFDPFSAWRGDETRMLSLCLEHDKPGRRFALCLPMSTLVGNMGYRQRDGIEAYDISLRPYGIKNDELIIGL